MHISFVLSSGSPLFTLTVNPKTSIVQLKSLVSMTLQNQLTSSPLFPSTSWTPSPAFSFRSDPDENLDATLSFLRNFSPRLFVYQGEELQDSTNLRNITGFVCVLRPTDLIARYSDLQDYPSRTVINTTEDIRWKCEQVLTDAIDTLIATPNCYIVCSVLRSYTLLQLKRRFAWAILGPIANTNVHYEGRVLEDNHTLDSYQIRDWSFLSAFAPSERALPAPNSSNFPNYTHVMQTVNEGWCPFRPLSEDFECKGKLESLTTTHVVTFKLSAASSVTVTLPKGCDVLTAKRCISEQHGLPVAMVAIGVTMKLDLEKKANEYQLQTGDTLILYRKTEILEYIKVYFRGEKGKTTILSVLLTDTILQLKRRIQGYFSNLNPPLTLLRGQDILEDSLTAYDYGLSTNDAIYVTDHCFCPDLRLELGTCGYISPKPPAESSLQDYRYWNFSEEFQHAPYYVRVVSPGDEVYTRIHEEATVAVVKATLRTWLGIDDCVSLRKGERELEDAKTLLEQGIGYNDTLLLTTPSSISISVVTPTGLTYPVVLNPDVKLLALNRVLAVMPGLPNTARAYTCAKRLNNETDIVPVEECELQMWIQLGTGTELQLAAELGREVRVEASASDTIAKIREKLAAKIPGSRLQLSLDGKSVGETSPLSSYAA